MNNFNEEGLVNIGTGEDLSILELAQLVQKTVGYEGHIELDATKPDGTPRKLMNVSKLHGMGWKHQISLEEGIKKVVEEVKNQF